MASLVGSLRAMLTLDTAAFEKGADKAGKSKGRLEKDLKSLGPIMKKLSVGLAVAGAAMAAAIKGQLNAADEMGKAAQKFGVPIEELSRLKYAADLSDVSLETLGVSLGQLSKKMVAAANGGKTQVAMFKEIGVEVVDAEGKLRSTEAVLQDVSDIFARMPDGAEKTALAMQLFGKSGTQMIPMLNSGKSSLQAMADEAQKLGIVIDEKTATAAEDFNDALTRLQTAAGGLVMQLTAALAPTLASLAKLAVDVAIGFASISPATKDLLVTAAKVAAVMAGVAVSFSALAFLFSPVKAVLTAVAVSAATLASAFRLLLLSISPVSLAIAGVAAGAALIYYNWDGIAAWFSEQWASIKQSTEEAWASVKTSIGGAITYVTGLWDAFVGKLQAAIQIAKDVGAAIADAMAVGREEMNSGEGYGGMGGAGDEFGIGALTPHSSNSYSTGASAADGMVNGFRDRMAQRMVEIAAAAQSVTDRVRQIWQVQSPSQVFREIGGHLTEGLALGIKDNVPMVDAAMGEVGETVETLKQKMDSFKSFTKGLFTGVVTGAMSVREAVGQLASKFAEMLANKAFEQLFSGLFSGGGFLSNLFGGLFADGAAFNGGRVTAFATGGIVNGATAFGMQGGLGIMGEAGPEAIMPLARGRGGKLGVVAQGGGERTLRVVIEEGQMFASRVEAIADDRSVQVVKAYDREVLPQSRSRNGRERG